MACLETIEAGHKEAVSELLFLRSLLIDLGCRVEIEANCPRALGFTDVYRSPAFRTNDFIRLEKPSQDLLESVAALRLLASERVKHLVEGVRHGSSPPIAKRG